MGAGDLVALVLDRAGELVTVSLYGLLSAVTMGAPTGRRGPAAMSHSGDFGPVRAALADLNETDLRTASQAAPYVIAATRTPPGSRRDRRSGLATDVMKRQRHSVGVLG